VRPVIKAACGTDVSVGSGTREVMDDAYT